MLSQPPQRTKKNISPAPCTLCGRSIGFVIAPTGKLETACLDCPGGDPLHWPHLSQLMNGELRPPQQWRGIQSKDWENR